MTGFIQCGSRLGGDSMEETNDSVLVQDLPESLQPITISPQLEINTSEPTSSTPTPTTPTTPTTPITPISYTGGLELLDLTQPDDFSDVTLVIEDKQLYTCRGILASASPVWRRMFVAEFKEKVAKEIPLPDKQFDEVMELLLCISPAIQKPITGKIELKGVFYCNYIQVCM